MADADLPKEKVSPLDRTAMRLREADALLKDALHIFEYATYHDGRYGQVDSEKFQKAAIEVQKKIRAHLGVKPYELQSGGKL